MFRRRAQQAVDGARTVDAGTPETSSVPAGNSAAGCSRVDRTSQRSPSAVLGTTRDSASGAYVAGGPASFLGWLETWNATEWVPVTLERRRQRVLESLIVLGKPEDGFYVTPEAASQRAGMSTTHFRSERARLRNTSMPDPGAMSKHNSEPAFMHPDAVMIDWFYVLVAERQAADAQSAYERAERLATAEAVFVQSYRLLQEWKLPHQHSWPHEHSRRSDTVEAMVQKRWMLRRNYLEALRDIGHSSRMITEYRLWRAFSSSSDDARWDPTVDMSFAAESSEQRLRLRPSEQLDTMGKLLIPAQASSFEGKPRPLAVAAEAAPYPTPFMDDGDFQRLKIRVTDLTTDRVSITWSEVECLISRLMSALYGLPDFPPQVVVALGRSGALPAAAVSHIIDCRLLGWVAVSRYRRVVAAGEALHEPYIRGRELPVLRATSVLVMDDVLDSGRSARTVIDRVLSRTYPEATFVVGGLVLYDHSQERQCAGEHWIGGVRVQERSRPWLDFPWAHVPRR